jgi:transposase
VHYETSCGVLIKLLWFDGQGLCLFSKRLDKGHFQWPVTDTGRVSLTLAQLSMLLVPRVVHNVG